MPDVAANTPVLVGVAAVQQKIADPAVALEPVALMERALRDAAAFGWHPTSKLAAANFIRALRENLPFSYALSIAFCV